MRVFSDEALSIGERLDLDVLLADGTSVRCWAEVVWRIGLGAGAESKYEIGLKFTDMAPTDIQRLASVLGPARSDP
jgi:hypothetical protein